MNCMPNNVKKNLEEIQDRLFEVAGGFGRVFTQAHDAFAWSGTPKPQAVYDLYVAARKRSILQHAKQLYFV